MEPAFSIRIAPKLLDANDVQLQILLTDVQKGNQLDGSTAHYATTVNGILNLALGFDSDAVGKAIRDGMCIESCGMEKK